MSIDLGARRYAAVVLGGSAGAMDAFVRIFSRLPGSFPWPLAAVLHLHPNQEGGFVDILDRQCALRVKEAEDKEAIVPGRICFAPPNYHLLVEQGRTFALSAEEKVKHARPSIDVLFESAADAWRSRLIGVVLSGASDDGADGLRRIKDLGGLTVVQDPAWTEHPFMPRAAMEAVGPDHVLDVEGIADLLISLAAFPPVRPGTMPGSTGSRS